jgi:hypothetical protein
MKVSPQATKGHLSAGIILVALSLISLLGSVLLDIRFAAVPIVFIFFLGVWGGVEVGRFLEYSLSKKIESK